MVQHVSALNGLEQFKQIVAQDFGGSLQALVSHVLSLDTKLASGSRSTVYSIPSAAHYVLRVAKSKTPFEFGVEEWLAVPDVFPEKNIGQVVAETPSKTLQILRYQTGVTYAVDYSTLFQKYDIDAVLGEGTPVLATDLAPYVTSYRQHLALIARMEQSAFDDLAITIRLLSERGLHFDPCSTNILVDVDAEAFNTVDHAEDVGPYATILGMAAALMDTVFLDLDDHAVDADGDSATVGLSRDPALVALRKRILLRVLMASLRSGLPVSEEPCPVNAFGYRQRSYDMGYVMRVSGLGGTDLSALI
jgi:hypothetical protein